MNEFKIVLLGNQSVGKSKILERFCDDCYKELGNPTIGAAFASKEITVLGQQLKLMIWDTAGQEVFRSMNKIYYQQAQVAILVYDVSKKETWKGLQRWYDDLKDNCDVQAMLIIVAANKCDLKKMEDGRKYCQENNLHYHEVSAKTGQGIQGKNLIDEGNV